MDTWNSVVSLAYFGGLNFKSTEEEMFAIYTLNSLKLRTYIDSNLFTNVFLYCFCL